MGVLRWRSLLDKQLRNTRRRGYLVWIGSADGARLAAYQMLFLDRVPQRAAVHESVELVKRAKKPLPFRLPMRAEKFLKSRQHRIMLLRSASKRRGTSGIVSTIRLVG